MSTDALSTRARRLNGLPLPAAGPRPLAKRVLTSPWTWVTIAAVIICALILIELYRDWTAPQVVEPPPGVQMDPITVDGATPGMIWMSAGYAFWTLLFWILVFLIVDRFRPQRPLVWFYALGWGSCMAVWISRYANTWVGQHMGVVGFGDPATATRVAVFVAPFIEEFAKATVLFWLAILVRQRLVSKLTMVCLGGLSAAGFAFTENVQYYWHLIWEATHRIDVGNPQEVVLQLVWLRGVVTAFGHPLFTIMTATGLAIALRTRSKVVRVLAPLAGFLLAAGLHMLFNSQASLQSNDGQLMMYLLIAVPMVLSVTIFVVTQVFQQGRLIRSRLTDYVRVGLLVEADPVVFAKLRLRLRAWVVSLSRGWRCWLATLRLQNAMTELAYLRDAETKGLVDEIASARAQELLGQIGRLRSVALADPRGEKINLPKLQFPWRNRQSAGSYTDWPPPGGGAGPTTRYSAVDPTWAPPPG